MKKLKKLGSFLLVALMAVACSTSDPVSPDNGSGDDNGNNNPPIESPIPAELDASPEKFEGFHRRVMILDHTGTGCGFCPYIIGALHKIDENETTKDRFVAIANHSYNYTDPMYSSLTEQVQKKWHPSGGAPFVNFDLRTTKDAVMDGTYENTAVDAKNMEKIINKLSEEYPAKAGIAATVKNENGKITVTAYTKIAETGKYKICAWLLEDGIKADQTNYGASGYDYSTHDHALRANFSKTLDGESLGNGVLEKGACITSSFTLESVPKGAKVENCRVVIFVTTPDNASSSKYYVTNIVSCPIGGSVAMEYAR